MRVISGKFKGRKLNTFELSTTRPTTDMMREALFDKIGYKVADCCFLDLFSGTGAVGIEALSRGASQVFFVDQNVEAIKLITKNLSLVKAENAVILNRSFVSALKHFSRQQVKFDIVFLDPPYKTDFAEQAIQQLVGLNLLNQNAIVVWEHDNFKLQYVKTNFANATTKKYGDKFLTYLAVEDME